MTKRGDNLKEKDLDDILYESTLPKQARTVFCESANLSAAQRYCYFWHFQSNLTVWLFGLTLEGLFRPISAIGNVLVAL